MADVDEKLQFGFLLFFFLDITLDFKLGLITFVSQPKYDANYDESDKYINCLSPPRTPPRGKYYDVEIQFIGLHIVILGADTQMIALGG